MSITLSKQSSQTSATKKRKPKVMRSDAQWKALLEGYSQNLIDKLRSGNSGLDDARYALVDAAPAQRT